MKGCFYSYDGAQTPQNADVKALLIYSDNDSLVHKNIHYNALYNALKDKGNAGLVLTENKGRNPNYSDNAVMLLTDLAKRTKKEIKSLDTPQKKLNFKNSFDWEKITEQDENVWEIIFDFLK